MVNKEFRAKVKGAGMLVSVLMLFAVLAVQCAPRTVGQVIVMRSQKHHTATVELDASAQDVYNAILRIVQEDRELHFLRKDSKNLLVEAQKEDRHFSAQVYPLGEGASRLVLTVDAGKLQLEADAIETTAVTGEAIPGITDVRDTGRTGEELAVKSIMILCDELEIKCQVNE